MGNAHLTPELLDAVFGEERIPGKLLPVVLDHLLDLCPTCVNVFEVWRNSPAVTAALSYEKIAEAAVSRATEALEEIQAEEEMAKGYLDDILKRNAEERTAFLATVPKEAKGPALAKILIETAREAMPEDPRDSLALARLARTVLQNAKRSPFVAELYARAIAYVGNAQRVLGSLSEAAEVISHARFILRHEGGGDRFTRSELDNLEGMVCLHQRDYQGAERLLKRAVLGFRIAGAQREALRSGMNLAILYRYSGNLANAVETQRQLNQALEHWDDERLTLFGYHNLAGVLCDAGEYAEAQEWLAKTTPFLKSPIAILRAEWLEGTIAEGQGDMRRAESHLKAAQYGFRKYDMAFDTALVSLELACVYLKEGRLAEVKELASEVVQVFEGQERHSESLAAVLVFRAAAQLERVTLDLVKEIALYLGQAALDPSFKFKVRKESAPAPTSFLLS